ncbi:TRAP-type mannitol/chloroaromatic compound transport system, large permease component [Variovorax sp. YR752]|uniref:TRAP transporter large permease subunit n=1 Tax=Variovorax sp. YR752 TaxID=1884383 RepID=UPI000BC72DEA|nr:TRAP transporter large permease subunit [Variovorax sp. YR752]SOD29828.1 TRAP-type mannitol/chloroaromatic compound transport system, large permease component [Variovorax sp. YR752]
MAWLGLALLALALALMMTTGWPTYAVLLGVCTLGAVAGLALGAFDAALLQNLPWRIVGLLEHDLLQALALYALVGALLNRLALAEHLYNGLRKALAFVAPRAASELAGMVLGLMLAPMNGSVGASLLTLARTAGKGWAAEGLPAAQRTALVAVTSTLGVIVPPSLVLLLLGDAMLRAHTEGVNMARTLALPTANANRIVNTQDILQAALVPAAALLLGWLAVAWFGARRNKPAATAAPREPMQPREGWTLLLVPLLIGALLVLVTLGRVRAVEGAAAACVLLLGWGLVSRQLTRAVLWQVLDDAMALTGALYALLVAATTFSLLLRGFGTDGLIARLMLSLQGHPMVGLMAVLAVLLACAFVLDAFELIFLIVPIVMPPVLAQLDDAAWIATLTLLVLQAGFLLPPFGYALVLARGQVAPRPPVAAVARALAPYLAVLATVTALVMALPETTRWLRSSPTALAPAEPMNDEAVDRLMREMAPPDTGDSAAPPEEK